MLAFRPELHAGAAVLCLGAHCDDIELGCAGTLMTLQQREPSLRFVWVVFSGDDVREAETRAAAARLLGDACSVSVRRHRASYFPHCGHAIKDAFEALRGRIEPQLVFTHHLADRHQDHRVIAELTWNSFRNHGILEYEIANFEGDLGHPNCYVPLPLPLLERKLATLNECFPSQRARTWFDAELFRGHMRLRGMECNADSRYAEGFHVRKLRL